MNPNVTEIDVEAAVKQLCRSERGLKAMRDTLAMLSTGGMALDAQNQQAILTLLFSAFNDWPGYTLDVMRAAVEEELHARRQR